MSTTTVNNGVEMPTSPPKVDIPNMAKTGTLATFTGQNRTVSKTPSISFSAKKRTFTINASIKTLHSLF